MKRLLWKVRTVGAVSVGGVAEVERRKRDTKGPGRGLGHRGGSLEREPWREAAAVTEAREEPGEALHRGPGGRSFGKGSLVCASAGGRRTVRTEGEGRWSSSLQVLTDLVGSSCGGLLPLFLLITRHLHPWSSCLRSENHRRFVPGVCETSFSRSMSSVNLNTLEYPERIHNAWPLSRQPQTCQCCCSPTPPAIASAPLVCPALAAASARNCRRAPGGSCHFP